MKNTIQKAHYDIMRNNFRGVAQPCKGTRLRAHALVSPNDSDPSQNCRKNPVIGGLRAITLLASQLSRLVTIH